VQTGVIEAEVTPAADNTFTIIVKVRLVRDLEARAAHEPLDQSFRPKQ
jgi:hypothetical protein